MAAERIAKSSDESTKQRAERIDRDYYHRPDSFMRWKRTLAFAALVIGIGWCAWGALDQDRHYSPGRVANAHAMWENNCDACHVPFTPIRGDTWLSSAESRQEMDKRCQACHQGPPHHWAQKPEDIVGCATCHTDHHGREASLVRVDDKHCIDCHANLEAHRTAKDGKKYNLSGDALTINRFDLQHPDFGSATKKEDDGTLKFSHKRHMAKCMGLNKNWNYSPEYRDAHMPTSAKPDDPMQLSCSSCHQFAGGERISPAASTLPSAAFPERSSGAHSLPIVYESHCAACHPLDLNSPTADKNGLQQLPENPEVVPHRLNAAGLRDFLTAHFSQKLLSGDQELKNLMKQRKPPLPSAATLKSVGERLNDEVTGAAKRIEGKCNECHTLKPDPVSATDGKHVWFNVEPTQVRQVWFPNARFNHQPHRAIQCEECHAAPALAAGQDATKSLRDDDLVMIPARQNCLQCHAAAPTLGTYGARFDCVECHAYHQADHPRDSLGSPERGVQDAERRIMKDFIKAIPSHP